MEQQAKKQFLINVIYVLVITSLTVIISRFLLLRMFPFLLSLLVAAISQHPAKFLCEKTKIKKPFCAIFLSAGIYLGVVSGVVFIVYKLILSSVGLTEYLPHFFSKFSDIIIKIEGFLATYLPPEYRISLNSILAKALNNLTVFLTNTIQKIATVTPSVLLSSVVALVATCYISKDFDGLSKFVKSLCGEKIYNRFLRVKIIFSNSVLKIFKGYFVLMIITFFELWIGLSILKIKGAYLWAFIIALVDILPVLGTGVVMIPWALYCVFAGNTGLAVSLSFLYIIMVVVRNFLEPKIVSQQLGINPLFMLFSMYLGLKLFGGVGLLILPLILVVTVKYYKEEM